MLQRTRASVVMCLERAAAAEANAAAVDALVDAEGRAEWLVIARQWRVLAASYEMQGRLDQFLK